MATIKQAYLELKKIDEQIDALYLKKEKLVKQLITKKGHGHEEIIQVEGDVPYMRIRLIDNLKVFESGVTEIWTHSAARRYGVKIDFLKNPPKPKDDK